MIVSSYSLSCLDAHYRFPKLDDLLPRIIEFAGFFLFIYTDWVIGFPSSIRSRLSCLTWSNFLDTFYQNRRNSVRYSTYPPLGLTIKIRGMKTYFQQKEKRDQMNFLSLNWSKTKTQVTLQNLLTFKYLIYLLSNNRLIPFRNS